MRPLNSRESLEVKTSMYKERQIFNEAIRSIREQYPETKPFLDDPDVIDWSWEHFFDTCVECSKYKENYVQLIADQGYDLASFYIKTSILLENDQRKMLSSSRFEVIA